jgi:hypothetical protein
MTGIRPSLIAASRRRAFNPLSLSPALWLDANDLSGSDGTQIATWTDKSGNGRNAMQATSVSQPKLYNNVLNGNQVARFDGVNDFLDVSGIPAITSLTTLAVFSPSFGGATTSAWFRVFSVRGPANDVDFSQSGHYIPIKRNLSTSTMGSFANSGIRSTAAGVSNQWEIRASTHTGSSITNHRNGVAASAYAHTLGNVSAACCVGGIGGSFASTDGYLLGDIAEILVYPTALSTADRQKVESYLSQKYNIALA